MFIFLILTDFEIFKSFKFSKKFEFKNMDF
jgi:hypothetical protein